MDLHFTAEGVRDVADSVVISMNGREVVHLSAQFDAGPLNEQVAEVVHDYLLRLVRTLGNLLVELED